jgi:glycosyltransferase involved in cell wall biosynthesis
MIRKICFSDHINNHFYRNFKVCFVLQKSLIYLLLFFLFSKNSVDIIGPVINADGIGQISINLFETISTKIKTNLFSTKLSLDSLSDSLKQNIIYNKNKKPEANIVIFTMLAPHIAKYNLSKAKDKFKIAISLFESDQLPPDWVASLNNNVDLVIVSCNWLINVYKRSGVIVPVYCLNLPIDTSDLVKKEKAMVDKFIFGMSAGPWQRKNHLKLIEAFKKQFGQNNNLHLYIHIREFDKILKGKKKYNQNIVNYCKRIELAAKCVENIKIFGKTLTRKQYVDFLQSLDCYVLPSGGEGYSITPREALILGIPCILSKNSAHLDLLNVPGIEFIKPSGTIKSNFDFKEFASGFQADIKIEDLQKALVDIYENYENFKKAANINNAINLKISYESMQNDYLNLLNL